MNDSHIWNALKAFQSGSQSYGMNITEGKTWSKISCTFEIYILRLKSQVQVSTKDTLLMIKGYQVLFASSKFDTCSILLMLYTILWYTWPWEWCIFTYVVWLQNSIKINGPILSEALQYITDVLKFKCDQFQGKINKFTITWQHKESN